MTAVPTAASAATRPRAVAREVPAGRRPGWWGMVLALVTDVAAFAAMLASYFYIRFVTAGDNWPPGQIPEPTLFKASVMTALLLTSSVPLFFADFGIKKGRRGRLVVGVALTLMLGGAFLYVQTLEYMAKVKEFDPTTNAYGSLFFLVTGFHGLHVILGLLALLLLLVASVAGVVTENHHALVRITGLYWHTVGAVWIFIFGSLYLAAQL